jgi:glycosyltransferase involved in cell wall biosynthesis
MKNKLLLFEPLAAGDAGHGLDNLLEDAEVFKKNYKIIAFVNKNFNKNIITPTFVELFKICETDNKCRMFNLLPFIKNFIFFIKFLIKKKKTLLFIKAFIKNFLTFPHYFFSCYMEYFNCHLNQNDQIIIESCRNKDIELFYFLSCLDTNFPALHIKVRYPPKKNKIKNFFFYSKKFKQKLTNKFNIYTENNNINNIIQKNLEFKIKNFTQPYTFYSRSNVNKILTLGFLGESRNEKGFNKLPELLSSIYKNNYDINFIIQISNNIYPETVDIRKKITELSKQYNKIKILNGYLDFSGWRDTLKKIDIMPILYDKDYAENIGSGLFYSCIAHEIPIIIPEGSQALKQNLKYQCYLEANNPDDYVNKILKLHKKYDSYLVEAKKQATYYKKILNDYDDLIKTLNK